MKTDTRQELLEKIKLMEIQLQDLKKVVKSEPVQKEWYTRSEFAKRKGLKPQTISNYLSRGEYGKHQRKRNGRWEIHKSELR